MLYLDQIRQAEFLWLAAERGVCASIYVPSTPLTQDTGAGRIQLKTLSNQALEQARAVADKRDVTLMAGYVEELGEDDEFWAHQANGLGVLLTPDSIRTYRLAYACITSAPRRIARSRTSRRSRSWPPKVR